MPFEKKIKKIGYTGSERRECFWDGIPIVGMEKNIPFPSFSYVRLFSRLENKRVNRRDLIIRYILLAVLAGGLWILFDIRIR